MTIHALRSAFEEHYRAIQGRWSGEGWGYAGLVLAWALLVSLSVAIGWPGFINPESCWYLPHYLSSDSIIKSLYDARVTELGLYPGRELALLFDSLDCHFIDLCVRLGFPHFLSISHYGFLLGAGLMLYEICYRHLNWGRLASIGWCVLLWTGPSEMIFTSYFRNAKVGLLFAVLLTTLQWCRCRAGGGWVRVMVFGAAALLMPMFDKQGLLFLLGMSLLLTLKWRWQNDTLNRRLMLMSWSVFAFAYAYQGWIGREIVWHLHHYRVEREYASFAEALQTFASDWRFGVQSVFGAGVLAVDSFRFGLGYLPMGVAIVAMLWCVRWHTTVPEGEKPGTHWSWHAGLIVFVMGCFLLMQLLLRGVLSSEHRRFYYPMAFSGIWFPWLAAALARCRDVMGWRGEWVVVGLGVMIFSNLVALQEHRFVLRHGYSEGWYAQTKLWRDLLKAKAQGEPMLFSPAEARARRLALGLPKFGGGYPTPLEKDPLLLFYLGREDLATKAH